MLKPQTIKRLVACFGSIQLVTALSVLNYREQEQRKLNLEYENYLVITPLWASQEQNAKFAAFIEKMANSIGSWKKIVYIPLEEIKSIAKKCKYGNFSRVASLVHKLLGIEAPDEIYLSREWMFENKLLMNVYEAAEKICYGDGIGIYFSQSAFPTSRSPQNLYSYLASKYRVIKRSLKKLIYKTQLQSKNKFDLGYFSLPYAFGEIPPMKTVILDKIVFLRTFQILKKSLENLIDINCIYNLCEKIENIPVSILLTSNFSEALGRISLENEIAAYRELLESHGIPESSILLIKPHPRDSRQKIIQLKSALSELYTDIFLLADESLFYLPFEAFLMEVFCNQELKLDQRKFPSLRIFTLSSSCLTLEFVFGIQCILGFGSDIVEKFFDQNYVASRLKQEADLRSTIQEIRANLSSDC